MTDLPVVSQSNRDKDVTQLLLVADSSFKCYPTPSVDWMTLHNIYEH